MMTKDEFLRHVESYESDTIFYSFCVGEKHPNFAAIIDAGEEVIPYLVEQLLRDDCGLDWCFALNMLVKDCPPIPEDKRGNVEAIKILWIIWARHHGYIV